MRLKPSPIIAVIPISIPLTFCGVTTLPVASKTSQIVKVRRKIILVIVPMISALCHPKVSSLDAGLNDIFMATMDIMKPTISEAKCAVSVKIAIEFARYPPMH
jgi:hypothetical protein